MDSPYDVVSVNGVPVATDTPPTPKTSSTAKGFGAYDRMRAAVALNPAEQAEADQQRTSPESLAELNREIASTKDPKARATLVEYRASLGVGAPPVEAASPAPRALSKPSNPYEVVSVKLLSEPKPAAAPESNPTGTDYLKSFGAGVLSGAGVIAQGGGELLARGVNAVAGTDLRAVNPLQGAIDWLNESRTPAAKKAEADSQIKGNVLDPTTWDFGKDPNAKGIALQGLNTLGQFAPNLAVALVTGGMSLPAQAAIGATVGGVQALGAGAGEERDKYLRMSPAELEADSELYRTLRAKGVAHAEAQNAVAEAAALGGGLGNAIPSAAEGAFENMLIGLLTRGKVKLPSMGMGRAGRVVSGAAGGAAVGGVEEAGEQMAQNAGVKMAVGSGRDIGDDTLGQFVMGALGEGALGGAGGVASRPLGATGKMPTEAPATAADATASPETIKATDAARVAELETKAKGTPATKTKDDFGQDVELPGKPGEPLSPGEQAEVDLLKGKYQARPNDPLGERLTSVMDQIKVPGFLAEVAKTDPQTKDELLHAAAIARNPKVSQMQREMALSGLEQRLRDIGNVLYRPNFQMGATPPVPGTSLTVPVSTAVGPVIQPAPVDTAIPGEATRVTEELPAPAARAPLPAPESPSGRNVMVNDTDPQLTRPEQMGDRETAINAVQAAREHLADAPGVNDIVQGESGPTRRAREPSEQVSADSPPPFQIRGKWPHDIGAGMLAIIAKKPRSMVERAVALAELDRRNPNRELDRAAHDARRNLWRLIVDAGGISEKEAADINIDPRSLGGYRMSGLVTSNGMRADVLARLFAEAGYLTPMQMEDRGGDEHARQLVADLLAREYVGKPEEKDLMAGLAARQPDEPTALQVEIAIAEARHLVRQGVDVGAWLAQAGVPESTVTDMFGGQNEGTNEGAGESAAGLPEGTSAADADDGRRSGADSGASARAGAATGENDTQRGEQSRDQAGAGQSPERQPVGRVLGRPATDLTIGELRLAAKGGNPAAREAAQVELDRRDVADYDDSVVASVVDDYAVEFDALTNMTDAAAMRALGFTEEEIADAEQVTERRKAGGPAVVQEGAREAGPDESGSPEGGGRADVDEAARGKRKEDDRQRDQESEAAVVASPVDAAAHEAAASPQNDKPEPTKEQILAGNAELGHPSVAGLDLSIENPAGSIRKDLHNDPPKWQTTMPAHYGYIKGTVGFDKDHLDVFVKPGTAEDWAGTVFVVNQNKGNGHFDESKVMLGYASEAEARAAYLSAYEKGWESRIRSIVSMDLSAFKAWAFDKGEKGPHAGPLESPGREAADQPDGVTEKVTIDAADALPVAMRDQMDLGIEKFPAGSWVLTVDNGNYQVLYSLGGEKFTGTEYGPDAQATYNKALARWTGKDGTGYGQDAADFKQIPRNKFAGIGQQQQLAPARDVASQSEDVLDKVEVPKSRMAQEVEAVEKRNAAVKAAQAKIDDVGEKIGGARKDTATSTGARGSRAAESDEPAWRKSFTIGEIVGSDNTDEHGMFALMDRKNTDWLGQPKEIGQFKTRAEAEAMIPIAAVARKHMAQLASVAKGEPEAWEIIRRVGDRKRVRVVEQTFPSREAALAYMGTHAIEILETKTSFGEEILPRPETVKRVGKARRESDVTGENFKDTYGFRGVEFGNWNNQDERQQVMNHAFDALADLADILNVPPKAIGLNGELALAFGARGQGLSGARAHYERDYGVINLTKMSGAGSLAHEWFHSLDHYFGRQDGKASNERETNDRGDSVFKTKSTENDMASHSFSVKSKMRAELQAAYEALIKTMFRKAETYVEDSKRADEFVGRTRDELRNALDKLRAELAAQKDPTYYRRNNKPASAVQLAELDGIAAKLLAGESLETQWRTMPPRPGAPRRALAGARWTNDALEQISALYKAVRGRSGFDSTNQSGVLDSLRNYMRRYGERLKMLADAQSAAEKVRQVPTKFAMEAKSIDQGRASDYWATPHEMAARAFEAYVNDRIAEGGGRSDFLTYGTNGIVPTPWGWKQPYPAGTERQAINAAFDKFVGELRAKETDKGVMMFSRVRDELPGLRMKMNQQSNLLPNFHNDRIALVRPRTQENPTPGTTRVAYDILDIPQFKAAMKAGADRRASRIGATVGKVLVDVDADGRFVSFRNIEVDENKRKRGYGGAVVASMLATNPAGMDIEIYDILPEARAWWDARGVKRNYSEIDTVIGKLNTDRYVESREIHDPERFKRAGGTASKGAGSLRAGADPGAARSGRQVSGQSDDRNRARVVEVQRQLEPLLSRWRNAPPVRVVGDTEELPIAAKIREMGAEREIRGWFDGTTAWLVAGNLKTERATLEVLFHEALGHAGLRGMLGDQLNPVLREVYLLNESAIRQMVETDYSHLDLSKPAHRLMAAEEYLAHMAQREATDPAFKKVAKAIQRIIAMLRDFVRGLGVNLTLSDADLQGLIAKARRFVESGVSGDVAYGAASAFARDASTSGHPEAFSRVSAAAADEWQRATQAGYRETAGRVMGWIDSKFDPLAGLDDKTEYLRQRYETLGNVSKADEIAKGIRETLGDATAEDKQAAYDYLTTPGATTAAIKDAKVRAHAEMTKATIESVGDALVERGLLSPEAREAHRGGYLPRLYLRHMLEASDWKALGAGKKPSQMGYLKKRKDVPEDVRKVILGEITDPAFLSAMGVSRPMRDMALLDWLHQISRNENWILPSSVVEFEGRRVSAYWLKDEAAQLRKQARYYAQPEADKAKALADRMETAADDALGEMAGDHSDFRQIPNTARYGRLRGMFVRKEIYDDVMGVQDFQPANPNWAQSLLGYGGAGTKLTQLWKLSKVALNPPGQVRNFLSNAVMLQLSGVPLHRVPLRMIEAIKDISANGKYYQIAKRYGVTESTFSAQEIGRMRRDLIELELQDRTLNPVLRAFKQMHRLAAIVGDAAGDLYQKSETIFKTAKIIDAMEREGLPEADAALESHKWMFDYSLVPQSIRYLRSAPIGVPFATFMFKVAPRMLEVALAHPQRLLPWAALFYALPMLIASGFDVDDEDLNKLKKALPEFLQEKGHAMFLPYRDELGRMQVVDLGYFFPWSQWSELASHLMGAGVNAAKGELPSGELGKAVQSAGIFGGPLADVIVALKTGQDPFTKRDIWDKRDPAARQAADMLNYVWSVVAPPFLTSRGVISPMGLIDERYGGKAVQAATGTTDRYGDPRATAEQAALALLGMNLYAVDPDNSRAQNVNRLQFEIKDVERRAKQQLKDRSLSPEKRIEVIQEYQTEIQRRYVKMQEYLEEAQIHPNLRTQKREPVGAN